MRRRFPPLLLSFVVSAASCQIVGNIDTKVWGGGVGFSGTSGGSSASGTGGALGSGAVSSTVGSSTTSSASSAAGSSSGSSGGGGTSGLSDGGPDAASDAPGCTTCGDAGCVDTLVDSENCGGCGIDCTQGLNATAFACSGGICQPTCAPGYGDVDGDPVNGCESTLPTGVGATSSLVLWLDGTVGFEPTATPPVWHDQSGNGRDAVQASFPTANPSGWGVNPPTADMLAGRTVASFNGGHSEMLISAGFPSFAQGLTMFVVYRPISNDSYWLTLGTSINTACESWVGCTPYNFVGFASHEQSTNYVEFMVCSPADGTCLHSYANGPGINTWVHWSMRETVADVTSGPYVGPPANNPENNTPMAIGGAPTTGYHALAPSDAYPLAMPIEATRTDSMLAYSSFVGKIAEVILFDAALSDAQVAAIDAYLKTKWGY